MTWPAGEPLVAPVQRSRLSLRARLIALVLLVALLALAVVDIVLPRLVSSALNGARDQSLTAVLNALPPKIGVDNLRQLTESSPLKSGIGWSITNEDGRTILLVGPADGDSGPDLSGELTAAATTVYGVDSDDQYRVLSKQLTDNNTGDTVTLSAWTNSEDISDLSNRLVLTELLITLGLLVLLGSAASILIRRELKPLENMADVADSIAAGDLSRRATVNEAGIEVDRLGVAFNGMLDGINTLIAERHAAEQRLRQFVADASHELRTPVAAVRGYTDLYAAGALPEPPAVGRAMERMGFESRRMGALVEDLLTLVQADTPVLLTRETVDLVELLHGVVEDAAAIDGSRHWRLVVPSAGPLGAGPLGGAVAGSAAPVAGAPLDGSGGTVAVGLEQWSAAAAAAAGSSAPPVYVAGDRHRLHQLFANLLGNVRTHTAVGTTATVGFEPDPDPRFVTITVADDGGGVEPAALPYLFDRFYRADPSRSRMNGGSGLGLAIVAAIAGAHGGAVSAAAAPAGGLLIRVRLPLAAPAR